MLIAPRSSQDLACCLRATVIARSKCASAFAASGFGIISSISPAVRWTSDSVQRSLVTSTIAIASRMQLQAAPNCPSFAAALARFDRLHERNNFDPDDRYALIVSAISGSAFENPPVRERSTP
jgi:hypothetical protein